ncbi:MAG: hypothetical protein KBE91_00900 [Bacteroidia bacterium]|nr:hypothetical protein [Bacteroidia bacterium]
MVASACSKSDTDTNPQQPIVSVDSSEYNGRLKVEVRNVNNNIEQNAIVYLYPSYQDLQNNLSLNYIYTNNNGLVDFGYLLQGNYYLLARSLSGAVARDTAVVQVNSHRETLRIMNLTY